MEELGLEAGCFGGESDVCGEFGGRGGREVGCCEGLRGEVLCGGVVLLEGCEGGFEEGFVPWGGSWGARGGGLGGLLLLLLADGGFRVPGGGRSGLLASRWFGGGFG